MASYNELTHSQTVDVNSLDPLYRWDTHFPERLSKLHLHPEAASPGARRQRGRRNRNAARFKTQPITFDEIKEVDEEAKDAAAANTETESFQGIKSEFAAFSRSMDGLLPGSRREKTREPSTDSNKENTPCEHTAPPGSAPAATVLSPRPNATSPPSASSTPAAASGTKIPAGLPTERDSSRTKRRMRSKKGRGIAEEAENVEKNGESKSLQ